MTTTVERRATLTERVAEEIRALMGRRKVTGARIARELGVSAMWVSDRINGKQPIDLNDLERIADVLGVPYLNLIPDGTKGGRRLTEEYPSVPVRPIDNRPKGGPRRGARAPKKGRPSTDKLTLLRHRRLTSPVNPPPGQFVDPPHVSVELAA